jgi:mRNA interferase RelE/StbE
MNSSSFRIETDPAAARDLRKLRRTHPQIVARLIPLVERLAADPFQGKPLKGEKQGCYSLRQGDYRLIYEIYPQDRVVHLIRVGHRRDIYR